MNDQVEEVKQKTDIVSLIGEYVQLKKAGRNFKALCPFHSEKTPSFMVSSELQIFKCFGCQSGGDAITFLQKHEGMEFREALEFLADRVGVRLQTFRGETGEKERLYAINSLVASFYHFILLNHPAGENALSYLINQRDIKTETMKTFKLGFSPSTPDVLKNFLVDKKKVNPRDLEKVGLGFFKGNSFIDKFGGRIIFPLYDHRGNIAGFAGRVLPSAGKDVAKYINSPETPVYHKSSLLFGLQITKQDIKEKGEVVVVEGELDAISSWQAGFSNTVAIKGSALTEDQVRLLSRFTKKAILALDSDLAGDRAARRGVEIAQELGMEVRVARFKEFKDPDETVRSNPQGYAQSLGKAVNVWDFIIDSVFLRSDAKTPEGKARISRELIPVLTSIPDKIVQAHYISVSARKLGVPLEAVSDAISQFSQTQKFEAKKVVIPGAERQEKSRRQLLEERLLSLAFQSEPKILLQERIINLLITPKCSRILEEYKNFSQRYLGAFNPSEFASVLAKELVDGFVEMILKDVEEFTQDSENLQKELDLVIKELEILEVRRKLERYSAKIRYFEEANEMDKMKEVQIIFSKLSQKLADLEGEKRRGIILQET